MSRIACFVSPHGFGHAARSCALIERLSERDDGLCCEIFTTVPEWFFRDALGDRFHYHELACDLGLVQHTALAEDIPATVAALDRLLPFDEKSLDALAERMCRLGCEAVICDISPLGIAAARRAGLPVALVENFTWGWIYRHHAQSTPALRRHAERLDAIITGVDLHLQTEPECETTPGVPRVGPIARRPRETPEVVRSRLGIARDERVALVSMGGVRWSYGELGALREIRGTVFVIPGTSDDIRREGAVVQLPFRGPVHHPDLVQASDVVIGKPGYSTVAEAVHYGQRFLIIRRPSFPESPILEAFIRRHLSASVLDPSAFETGNWGRAVSRLLELPPRPRSEVEDGAAAAAELVLGRLLKGAH